MSVCKRCGKPVKAVVHKYCGRCRKEIRRERKEARKIKRVMKESLKG